MKRKNGEGTWGKKIINGKEYIRYSKTYSDKRKDFYGQSISEVKTKILKYEKSNMINSEITIAKQPIQEYMENWLNNIRIYEIGERTFLTNKTTFKNYVKNSSLGMVQIGNITSKDIQTMLNDMAKNYSRSTITKTFCLYNLCYDYAVSVGDLANNPCISVKVPRENAVAIKKKQIAFLDMDDIEKLYNEADRLNTKGNIINGKEGTRVYSANAYAIPLILYTGMRIGECTALQWKNVDLDNKTISIVQAHSKALDENGKEIRIIKTPKTKKSVRTIPISDNCIKILTKIQALRKHCNPDDFIITCKASNLTRTLYSMLKRANCSIEKCGLHALRHSYGSMLLSKGVDIKTISELMGHTDISTTANIYVNVSKKLAVDSVALLDKLNDNDDAPANTANKIPASNSIDIDSLDKETIQALITSLLKKL